MSASPPGNAHHKSCRPTKHLTNLEPLRRFWTTYNYFSPDFQAPKMWNVRSGSAAAVPNLPQTNLTRLLSSEHFDSWVVLAKSAAAAPLAVSNWCNKSSKMSKVTLITWPTSLKGQNWKGLIWNEWNGTESMKCEKKKIYSNRLIKIFVTDNQKQIT